MVSGTKTTSSIEETSVEEEEEPKPGTEEEDADIMHKDPISESYRSIINHINATSSGFRKGRKWKAYEAGQGPRLHPLLFPHMSMDEGGRAKFRPVQVQPEETGSARGAERRRRLVRQHATMVEEDDFDEAEPAAASPDEGGGRQQQKLHKQWTLDVPRNSPSNETAYLLRPISRNSAVSRQSTLSWDDYQRVRASSSGGQWDSSLRRAAGGSVHLSRETSQEREELPRSGRSSRQSGLVKQYTADVVLGYRPEYYYPSRARLYKQPTTDSAPSAFGSSRHLPRQLSVNGAGVGSSVYLHHIPPSASHTGDGGLAGGGRVTLVRGQSCSLVDIPTYLGSNVELGGIAGALRSTVPTASVPVYPVVNRKPRPRLQIDLTRKQKSQQQKASPRKTQWTVFCVAITLLTMCVTLVGTMLSFTSEYQDKVVATKLQFNTSSGLPSPTASTVPPKMSNTSPIKEAVTYVDNKFKVPVTIRQSTTGRPPRKKKSPDSSRKKRHQKISFGQV